MINLVFYTEPKWAFGSIHYELCKYLWPHGINAQVLSWDQNYTTTELLQLFEEVDYIVTNAGGIVYLKTLYGIDIEEKVIVIIHGVSEIEFLIHNNVDFSKYKGYYTVSDYLTNKSIEKGIARLPGKLSIGINFSNYYCSISNKLSKLGYAGATHLPIKRYSLVQEISFISGLPLITACNHINSYISMKGFYKNVDAILNVSTTEGAGLPVLEASAAGKLVFSTEVGHWNDRCIGVTLPMGKDELVKKAVIELVKYRDPLLYRNTCLEIQEHARSYDWAFVINDWIEAFS